jgi:hypothetical protein
VGAWSGMNAQQYSFGLMPSINLNHRFENQWSLNGKIESRQGIWSVNNGSGLAKFEYVLTDLSLLATKQIGASSKLSAGYLHRFAIGGNAARIIEQLSIVQKIGSNRLAHRIVLDQTFPSGGDIILRARYRIGTEISLQGSELNHGESYLKLSAEALGKYQYELDAEARATAFLGLVINKKNKLELGVEHRYDGLLSTTQKHANWLRINWFISL